MAEILDLPEQDPAGRQNVPKVFQDAFRIKPIKPTTGLPEGQIGPNLKSEGFLLRVRRTLSRVAERLDTNKENKPPIGKVF